MFTKAKIKLTSYYLIILILIMSVFSVFLYHYTAQHIQDSVEEDTVATHAEQQLANKAIGDLRDILLTVDLAVFTLAGFLSYFLARKTLLPIQEAHEAQTQFSANASHELRTPLSVMKTENELYLKNNFNFLEAESLAKSNLEEIERMRVMVENLLILARSDNTAAKENYTKTNLYDVIERVLKNEKKYSENKLLKIEVNMTKDLFINGNEKLLEQVFHNLIHNAITYTENGSLQITATRKKEQIMISIQDTGIGIEAKHIQHLTKAFYKADSSRRVTSNGVGLGLSIADTILRAHNGAMTIFSKLGEGTNVIVTVPSY